MLGRIPNNGEQDQPDKLLADVLGERVDGGDHIFSTESDENSTTRQSDQGADTGKEGWVFFVVLFLTLHVLVTSTSYLCANRASVGYALADTFLARFLRRLGGRLVVDGAVGFELEEEVAAVSNEKHHRRAAGCLRNALVALAAKDFEGGGDDQTADGEGEERGGGLGHGDVEVLLLSADAAEEEAHAHYQQQIGEHGSNERCLDDEDFALDQSDDADD
jgi:hypothetical protein